MKWIGTQTIYDNVRLIKGFTLDGVSISTIQDSSESFADNNTSVMTSAAIADKIEAYGYSTTAGDITGVTAGTGLSGGGTSGAVTLNVDAAQTQITSVGTIGTGTWQGTAINQTYLVGQSGTNTGDEDQASINALGITTVGAITTGEWRATAIPSDSLDADTAHLTTDQTFTGAKTFSAATTTFTSATANSPLIKVLNTTDDDAGSELVFEKLRDDNGVANGQNVGEIWFRGQDSGQNTEDYAYIIAEIDVSTHGQESGQLTLGVANHDGGNGSGLVLVGGSENNEIDVTVGLGANSVVTIPGNIDLAGDIDVDGTLETDALTIGGGTIAVAGTTAITRLGTIGTGVWQGTAVASAYLDADTAHYSATRQVTHHMITDDIDSDVIYISLGEIDAENTSATSKHLPLIAPTAGKLLKIFLRTSVNYSGETFTWKLYTRNVSSSTGGSPTEIGAQSGTGPTNASMVTYDFTSSLDSGTNAIAAGDKVQISIEAADGATANGNYFITCLWEWDLS